ncbi:MAG: hypothetical protein Q9183_002572, partial [Haloplaca sp. 2 TL-2023]
MASSVAKQPQQRQSTRSNSASSASIVTVTRAASSRNGPRPNQTTLKSQSPNEINLSPPNQSIQNLSPDSRRRSSAVYNRPDSGHGVREGVGNLNRWSQSTVSSKSSATHNRRNSFSKRLSESFGSFGGFNSPQSSSPKGKGALNPHPVASTSSEEASDKNPPNSPPKQPAPLLPPIVTLSSLTKAVEAADSPSTATTATPATAELLSPLTYQPQPDYFGNRWKPTSPLSQQRSNPPSHKTSPQPSPLGAAHSAKPTSQPAISEANHTAASKERAVSKFSKRGSVQPRERRPDQQRRQSRNHVPVAPGAVQPEKQEESASASDRHERDRRVPSQKAMLSKALQKANHAVLLDNAQNFEGAMDAYSDACALLQRVMLRSSGDEDRKKLESVRNTYSNRINELRNADLLYQNDNDSKALPRPPGNRDSTDQEPISPLTDEEDDAVAFGNATIARVTGEVPFTMHSKPHGSVVKVPADIPPRRHSLRPPENPPPNPWNQSRPEPQRQKSQPLLSQKQTPTLSQTLTAPNFQTDIPPPLSPRRLPPSNPPTQDPPSLPSQPQRTNQTPGDQTERRQHTRQETAESTSWLDTIDESGGSSASSVHSRTSSIGLRRKRIRAASGATEAEFDAALDAAVEAAYDDGFEPANDEYFDPDDIPDAPYEEEESANYISDPRHNVELAKERVKEAEREAAIARARDREKRRLQEKAERRGSSGSDVSESEEDDEERMLEEMTRGYVLDSEYSGQSKSALPRQSDSSGFSGRTWGSSIGSNPTSAGTSLSVAAGVPALPSLPADLQAKQMPPPTHPPPAGALPNLPMSTLNGSPVKNPAGPPPGVRNSNPGVRERRLSGIGAPQLKIETNAKVLSSGPVAAAPKTQEPSVSVPLSTSTMTEAPKSAFAMPTVQQSAPSRVLEAPANIVSTKTDRKASSPMPLSASAETQSTGFPQMPTLYKVTTADSEDSVPSVPDSPARLTSKSSAGPGTLRKNFSSSSLKKILTASAMDSSEPGNLAATTNKQRKTPPTAIPMVPTPKGANFIIEAIPSGGMHLLDNDAHAPGNPGMPNLDAVDPPVPLEPCPDSTLLRPFWFLRCIFQSITHPRGGYLSQRLFVPRDIWRVTNVKLKNVEDK